MKRCFVLFTMIICLSLIGLPINFSYAENAPTYFVTANSATVFEEANFASKKITTLNHKTEIMLEMENDTAKVFTHENYKFYKIVDSGYIFADLVCPKNQAIMAIPNFNAQTNSSCKVYFKSDNTMSESDITLKQNEQIFLYEGFDSKLDYTPIAFLHDNEVMYGYLKTEYVWPNGINPVVIYCIIIILAVLGIIFAWLFMKNKKVKLKSKKNGTKT